MFLVLRGHLNKRYTPYSARAKTIGDYDIDIFQYADFYHKLIIRLNNHYPNEVKLCFVTYDTTGDEYLKRVEKEFNPFNIYLASESKSNQFSTVCNALHHKPFTTCSADELILVLRSDILMTDNFIDRICTYPFHEKKNLLYTACQDRKIDWSKEYKKVTPIANHVDVFHGFYALILTEVRKWMCSGQPNAHQIHTKFGVQPIFDINKTKWLHHKEGMIDYLEYGRIKQLYSTWSGLDKTYFINEKYSDYKAREEEKKQKWLNQIKAKEEETKEVDK